MKNLYLPGTNKNIGYIDHKDSMSIYAKYLQYLPWNAKGQSSTLTSKSYSFILIQKEKETEKIIQLADYGGWFYNVDTKTYDFNNCQFKTPDNLDVVEMTYLYKNWSTKKKTK